MSVPTPVSPSVPPHPRRRGFLAQWNRHPAVHSDDNLTFGERCADAVRNGMGSWRFVGAFAVVLGLWVVANSVLYVGGAHGKHGFDPYPYILLNLFLSMLAAIQGAILLIAAKRSDQIASEVANHDYQTDQQAFERIAAVHDRMQELAEANRRLLEQNSEILRRLAGATGGAVGEAS